MEIEAARLLTYQAAWLADQAIAAGNYDARFTRESSMAKLYAGEVAVRVANEAVQIHGGYGFIKDYPAEKFYRDVKLVHDRRRHQRNSKAGNRAADFGKRLNLLTAKDRHRFYFHSFHATDSSPS